MLLLVVPGMKARGEWNSKEVLSSLKSGILSLLMPVVILGGIYSGFFTATESAGIAVLYAVVVELFIHRELKIKDAPKNIFRHC